MNVIKVLVKTEIRVFVQNDPYIYAQDFAQIDLMARLFICM